MKDYLTLLVISFFFVTHAQKESKLIQQTELQADVFVGCDYDMNYYYFSKTVLSKKTKKNELNYTNFLFGNITSVDISNPLKIVVFYEDFNVIILLDSQLNELDILQLPYDISHVTKGIENHIWLYTRNTQTIESYNYKTKTIVSKSQPLKNTNVLAMKSTSNYVYLLTPGYIKTYDYLGSFIHETKAMNVIDFQYNNRVLYTQSKNTIHKIKDSKETYILPQAIKIKNFFTINHHLYIFDGSQLYLFSTEKK
jgi:hypothetical protein